MKYLLILAIFLIAAPALAAVNYATTDGQIGCNGQEFLAGDELPSCGSGGIQQTTYWTICESNKGVIGTCSFVFSAAEYYRRQWLEVARQIVSNPVKSNWKGTIVQEWLDRYLGGER